jgi:hypothetical protein
MLAQPVHQEPGQPVRRVWFGGRFELQAADPGADPQPGLLGDDEFLAEHRRRLSERVDDSGGRHDREELVGEVLAQLVVARFGCSGNARV